MSALPSFNPLPPQVRPGPLDRLAFWVVYSDFREEGEGEPPLSFTVLCSL